MLTAAIFGLGWWGRTIVTTMATSPHLRITKAIDPDARAQSFAAEHNLAFTTDAASALNDPTIEAVILCTPHTLHAQQIQQAAAAGKHVFCEKPLCLTLADAEKSIAACNAHNVTLGVGHERRFEPPIQELRRLADTGALGTLLQIEANFSQDKFLSLPADNWRLSEQEAPAGPMTATGIHLLDLSVSFLGPADRVLTQVRRLGSHLENGDTLAALISFKSGATALISAILATPFDGRFAIYGSKGWAEVRDKAHPESPAGWTLTTHLRGTARQSTDFEPAPAVRANLEAFAQAATGAAPYPMSQSDMLSTIAAFESVVRSAKSGQIDIVPPASLLLHTS